MRPRETVSEDRPAAGSADSPAAVVVIGRPSADRDALCADLAANGLTVRTLGFDDPPGDTPASAVVAYLSKSADAAGPAERLVQSQAWGVPLVLVTPPGDWFAEVLASAGSSPDVTVLRHPVSPGAVSHAVCAALRRRSPAAEGAADAPPPRAALPPAKALAHELNNPLTAVLGYTDLLMARPLPDSVRTDLDRVRDQAERCRQIVAAYMQGLNTPEAGRRDRRES